LLTPIVTLGFILATLYGAVFHLIFGGDARRLALFLLSGWVGFALGHMIGAILEINIFNIHVASATGGALIALLAARVLSARQAQRRQLN
jgi:uncharacterized membrane protein YjjP (DUF1212 family)